MTLGPMVELEGTATLPEGRLFGHIEIRLEPGAWTCLLGPSGCGKTTVLRLIAGLETGVDFKGQVAGAEDGVAYMAQTDLLLPWLDALGNVTLGARMRGQRVNTDKAQALIARLGLSAHAAKRPSQLSGGQRQRVALARTLMENRAVVLLDEPFSALDARTRAEMQELAHEVLQGRTVLLVTHDPAEAARMGQQILVMQGGAVANADVPVAAAIRAVDAPDVLACQARLLNQLRRAA